MLFNFIYRFSITKVDVFFNYANLLLKNFCRPSTPPLHYREPKDYTFSRLLMQIYTLSTTLQNKLPYFSRFFFIPIFLSAIILRTP